MKRYVTAFIISLLYTCFIYGQTATHVFTCTGGNVDALINNDITQSEKDAIRADFVAIYGPVYGFTGADILEDPTPTFNCHAYAWHLREGNTNRVWIANTDGSTSGGCYINNNNINAYWDDGCFIQVCNEADADKIHYYCGDHSAVRSSVSGKYESKWGGLPALRHNPTSVPYNQPTSVNYYASTKITGDLSDLCSGTRTFSVKNISGATYSWTCSPSLTIVGAANTNSVTVQVSSTPGAAWVKVQISTSCSGQTVTKQVDFSAGVAAPVITGIQDFGHKIRFNAQPVPGATYYWYESGSLVYTSSLITYYEIRKNCASFIPVQVAVQTSCGTSPTIYAGDNQYGCTPLFLFTVSPNPATSTVSISTNASNARAATDNTTFDEVRIYDMQGNVKKSQRYNKIRQGSVNISDLPNGNYFIEVRNGTYKERKQLIIRK